MEEWTRRIMTNLILGPKYNLDTGVSVKVWVRLIKILVSLNKMRKSNPRVLTSAIILSAEQIVGGYRQEVSQVGGCLTMIHQMEMDLQEEDMDHDQLPVMVLDVRMRLHFLGDSRVAMDKDPQVEILPGEDRTME
jgi:hypothetical protein